MNTWRAAVPGEDDAIVAMSLALYAGEPGRMTETKVRQTLARFRDESLRGRALVLDAGGVCAGYAFLVSFWSNELGGEICTIDELYVTPPFRSQGHSTRLVQSLVSGAGGLWPCVPVALELEVAPQNERASALYRRLGFAVKHNTTLRLPR
jgi:ribosomal protein S18 acetylase RimI-like enzyme